MPSKSNAGPARWVRLFLALLLLPGLALGVFVLYLVAHHNFHVVSEGVLYRSSQMSGEAFARTIREHGIKTILNLRGAGEGKDWYTSEIATAQQYGVQHFDFDLSATRELKDEEMDRILATISTAPKPILIHCKSGSDRTGLVGALYLYTFEGRTARSADHQLALLYGHLPYFFWGGTVAMDNSFWRYVNNHSRQPSLAGLGEARAPARPATVASDPFLARGSAQ